MKKLPKLTKKQKEELSEIINNKNSLGPEVRRAQAILLVNKETDNKTVKAITKFSRKHSFFLRKSYLSKGREAICDKRKGKPKELLTKKEREKIIKIITTKTPHQIDSHRYESDFWTTGILAEYIKREYKVKYKSKTSYYIIFKKSKFTFHKPGRVYENRDEEEVRKWRIKAKKKISSAWKDQNTIIFCGDEMVLSTQTTFQKIWLRKGEYPKIEVSNNRKNRSVYGFLNVKTGKEHAYKTERQNMYETVKILKKIRKVYPDKKLLFFWDGAGWHRGSKVLEYIKKDNNIETFYFPKYSPEENPQEHVWKNGRDKITHNEFIRDIDKTTDEFVKYLRKTKFKYKLLKVGAV